MRQFCLQSIFISISGENIRKNYSKRQLITVQSRVIALCHVFHSCTSKKLRSHAAVHSLLMACFPLHILEMFVSCRTNHFMGISKSNWQMLWSHLFKNHFPDEPLPVTALSASWYLTVNDDRKISWTALAVHSIHQAFQNRPWRELTGKKISFSVEWWWRLGATC